MFIEVYTPDLKKISLGPDLDKVPDIGRNDARAGDNTC
jgi:hypothetical protein